MRPYMSGILAQDGAHVLSILTTSWAPNISVTYGSVIQRYFGFCEDHQIAPLAGTSATMARFVTRLGNLGTVKASSLH
jgi:hypothetical protein